MDLGWYVTLLSYNNDKESRTRAMELDELGL